MVLGPTSKRRQPPPNHVRLVQHHLALLEDLAGFLQELQGEEALSAGPGKTMKSKKMNPNPGDPLLLEARHEGRDEKRGQNQPRVRDVAGVVLNKVGLGNPGALAGDREALLDDWHQRHEGGRVDALAVLRGARLVGRLAVQGLSASTPS